VSVRLAYHNGSTFVERTFDELAIKGLSKPEAVRFAIRKHGHLDGSLVTRISGFSRRISIDLGVLQTEADQQYILSFLKANECLVAEGLYTAYVVPADVAGYEDEWIDGFKDGSQFVLELDERTNLSAFVETYVETVAMILFRKVLIAGTQDAPESFTTGIGKLALDVWGNAPPIFDGSTQRVSVSFDPYQERQVDGADVEPTISGGAVTFSAQLADVGRDSPDGSSYADIKIIVQDSP